MANSEPRFLLLNPLDNVLVAATATDHVPLGYKVARCAIATGEKIIKWGAPIGSATCAVVAGEILHLHNMKSDYIPTYAHGQAYGAGN